MASGQQQNTPGRLADRRWWSQRAADVAAAGADPSATLVASGVVAVLALAVCGFAFGYLYGASADEAPSPPQVALVSPAVEEFSGVGGPEDDSLSADDSIGAPAVGAVADLADSASSDDSAGPETDSAVAPRRGFDRENPLFRPVVGGWISSQFGARRDPFTGRAARHYGIDFAGHDNSAIFSAGGGIVVTAGRRRGYGNVIEIDHGGGWTTRYGHNAYNLVEAGDYVRPGQTIALMGATGRATGTHLHFEVRHRGRPVDPARLLPRAG